MRALEARRGSLVRSVTLDRLAWLTPVAIFVLMRYSPVGIDRMLSALIALGAVVVISRWPTKALTVLVVGIPFNLLVLATLYRLGMPAGIVRPLAFWKEGLIVAVSIAAVQRARAEQHRLDLVDKLVLALVGLGLAYMVLPGLLLGRSFGATLTLNARWLGFRTDVLYLVLFLACRHVRLGAEASRRLLMTALKVAAVTAVIGIYEWSFSAGWNDFVVHTLQVPRYQVTVLGVSPRTLGVRLADVRTYGTLGGRNFVRVGGPMLNYLGFGFYLAIAVAAVAELQVRGRGRPWMIPALPVLGAALLFTQTRAALIAAAVSVVLVLRPQRGRSTVNRLRFTLVLGALLVFAVPAVLAAGLSNRFSGDETSDTAHRNALADGFSTIVQHPIGTGLSTAAGAAQRLSLDRFIVAENQYLQVGIQLGVAALVLYVAIALAIPRALHRTGAASGRAPPAVGYDEQPEPDAVVLSAVGRTVLIGLLIGGLVLQPFIEFAVSWTAWVIVGTGLGALEGANADLGDGAPSSAASDPPPFDRTMP